MPVLHCGLCDLPLGCCPHGGDSPVPIPESVIKDTMFLDKPPWFEAAYRGTCSGCGGRIDPGMLIMSDREGGWLCDGCG
jgi:hypothetical protein